MNQRIETVLPDSEGSSAWIAQDRKILALFKVFPGWVRTYLLIGALKEPTSAAARAGWDSAATGENEAPPCWTLERDVVSREESQ